MKVKAFRLRQALLLSVASLGAASFAALAPSAYAQEATRRFDIVSQPLDAALKAFALRTGRDVLYAPEIVTGKRSPGAQGALSEQAALDALLAGTGLQAARTSSGFVVRQTPPQEGAAVGEAAAAAQVEDIVVTGTRIRGATPASPIQTISPADIARSGYSQTGDLLRSLPQNFNGGQNPGVQRTNNTSDNYNVTGSSTVNLRGLGSSATLVLLDGNRMAADGPGQAPDISAIPLLALQKVEIVSDGASALYGSDAVAGVVNFILRHEVDGAEISARLGGATDGGGFEQTYGGVAGRSWRTGSVMAAAEYSKSDWITADQRDFTSDAPAIQTLTPKSERKSFLLSAKQELTPWSRLSVNGLYATHDSEQVVKFASWAPAYDIFSSADFYQIDANLDVDLSDRWTAGIAGSLSRSDSENPSLSSNGNVGRGQGYENGSRSVQLTFSGPLIDLPSGPVRLAFGGAVRKENYRTYAEGRIDRQISSVFAEALAPLVQPSETRTGLNQLEVSASFRAERYDTFGEMTTPKFGLRYVPLPSLTLRGTWGRSFKAPSLYQVSQPSSAYLYDAAIVGGATGTFLFEYGGNPDLKPEKAKSWTAGFDWSPRSVPSLRLSATYFDTDYEDRIVYPITVATQALSNPIYEQFLTRNPSPAEVMSRIDSLDAFYNNSLGPLDPTQVVAIGHDLLTNASAQQISGLDVSLTAGFDLPVGSLDVFVAGTSMTLKQQTISTLPFVTLSGTLFNPAERRLRSGLTLTRGGLASTLIVNHISGGTDTAVSPTAPIASWTTVDANAAYRFSEAYGPFNGLEVSLSATNLLDKAPPYAAGAAITAMGLTYDSTNVSPVGRFVALTVRKRF